MISKKLYWTDHANLKMRQYGLSKSKLINLLYKPERKEQGIAPKTTALMKSNPVRSQGVLMKSKKSQTFSGPKFKNPPGEIWLMYADTKNLRKIISAWRYPGVSKPGEDIPIPEDIKRELLNRPVA